MKDSLGYRMKAYEDVNRLYLSPRSYKIIRVDGVAFHTLTKKLVRPFDDVLMQIMDSTAKFLCENIMGVKMAYLQSDEISLVVTDFDTHETQGWYGNNLQKMCSVSASMASTSFNFSASLRSEYSFSTLKPAFFDSRVFTLPTRTEVINYLIWRQQDATRNSISSVAQSLYSHKELLGKNSNQLQEMIFQKGTNWNDYAPRYKRGRIVVKESYKKDDQLRSAWVVKDPEVFTQDKELLLQTIPLND
jgi:tRNA(His) guanylyltransferase